MATPRITIKLESAESGRVPLAAFQAALDKLSVMLEDVAHECRGQRRVKVSWEIAELALGSATISVEPTAIANAALAGEIRRYLVAGLQQLSQQEERPPFFTDRALEKARELVGLVGGRVTGVTLKDDTGQQLALTEAVASNVGAILEYFTLLGSVEGRLEMLAGREGRPLRIWVRDVVTGADVGCRLDEAKLPQAIEAFRKRVLVSGLVTYGKSGLPRSIEVDDIELMPDELQPLDEDPAGKLPGFTGGLPPEQFLEEQYYDP